MSLISMRNIIMPFTNKVHLISIVLVALLFGLFRLSSGTIRIVPKGEVPVIRPVQDRSAESVDDTAKLKVPAKTSDTLSTKKDDDVLNSMIGSNTEKRAPEKRPSNDLSDIEKRLGLR